MRNKEIMAAYGAAILQGIALVAFPAAGTIFTNPHDFHFSSVEYGSLFIPQTIFAVVFSALSTKFSKKFGSKTTFLTGLLANLLSMSLLAFSAYLMHESSYVHSLLMIATSFLGLGFGLTVPTINTICALLRPEKIDFVILVLNALLGIGTALAPILIAIFVGLGFWFGLPLFVAFFLCVLVFFSLPLSLPQENLSKEISKHSLMKSSRFWIFASFALLYGMVETLNSAWLAIYIKKYQEANISLQSLTLTTFWSMVTLGRIFFAWSGRYIKKELIYQILPLVIVSSFILITEIKPGHPYASLFIFALAGLGCSALLPLTISLGSTQLHTASASGSLVSFYLLGYGISAFGVGPLQDFAKLHLQTIYGYGTFVAALLIFLSLILCRGKANN
ncbi:MAG: MFS transporter [Verrucomicrobia bacterium]|nr:MFS transporter [Verrucomicrobiota bacterium]